MNQPARLVFALPAASTFAITHGWIPGPLGTDKSQITRALFDFNKAIKDAQAGDKADDPVMGCLEA